MPPSAHDAYLESKVYSADPVELIRLLYRTGLSRIGQARKYLAAGDIENRARAINSALDVIGELLASLDSEAGEISRNLANLYRYVETQLLQANVHQSDQHLANSEAILRTLAEAWNQIPSAGSADRGAPVAAHGYTAPPAGEVASSGCWSF
jgi:flagellar secretion chaperone FliS